MKKRSTKSPDTEAGRCEHYWPGSGPKAARTRKRWGQPEEGRPVPPDLLIQVSDFLDLLRRTNVAEVLIGTFGEDLRGIMGTNPKAIRKTAAELSAAMLAHLPEDYGVFFMPCD